MHSRRRGAGISAFNPILVWFYPELRRVGNRVVSVLSIPFWSDFISTSTATALPTWKTFNPILVWFYRLVWILRIVYVRLLSIPFWSDFISPVSDELIDPETSFQSHFGLILSCRSSLLLHRGKTAFNPILVWFYHIRVHNILRKHLRLSIPFWSDFIKSSADEAGWESSAFNPILVWFYLSRNQTSTIHLWSFQSHFGLILSRQPWLLQARGH